MNISKIPNNLIEQLSISLGVSKADLRSEIVRRQGQWRKLNTDHSPAHILLDLERMYAAEAKAEYNLSQGARWEDIKDMRYQDLTARLAHKDGDARRRIAQQEWRRYFLAELLQLNKFTATSEEVLNLLNEWGINLGES